jgi:hypothetical protein
MIDLLAHITSQEVPSLWLVASGGFVAGVAATFVCLAAARKLK